MNDRQTTAVADTAVAARHHAILIGINTYPTKPLKGCVNDIREIEKYIRTVVVPVEIHVLVSSSDPAQAQSDDQANDRWTLQPTYENVQAAFRSTTSTAAPGDFVYVHFSGHGTRVGTSDEFSNRDTGDLALVLLDDDEAELREQYLRGAVLASWLKAMVDKGLVVTLVLDCCFAASVYRHDDLGVRYLSYDHKVDFKHRLTETTYDASSTLLSVTRDASMRPSWFINPDKYAILVACGPDQEAKELVTEDGRRHGVLSFFLLQTWRRFGGIREKHKAIYHNLCIETQKCNCRQHPILYGSKGQGFFGSQDAGGEATMIALWRNIEGGLSMQAGHAHGMCVGDEVAISPIRNSSSYTGPKTALLIARVVEVRGLTSDLEWLEEKDCPPGMDLAAEIHARASFSRYRIKVANDLPNRDETLKTFQVRAFDTTTGMTEIDFAFNIALDDNIGCYKITGRNDIPLRNLPVMKQQDMHIDEICNIVEHLTRYVMVRELANGNSAGSILRCVDVCVNHARGSSHPGDLTVMKSGEICELRVTNKLFQDLYVFAYDLGPSWQVENLLRGTYEVIPPEDHERGFTGLFRKKLKMMVPSSMVKNGYRECEDTMKVILTTRPTSFDLLELPKLGSLLKRKDSKRDGPTNRHYTSDDWVAWDFPIRTLYGPENIEQ